MVRTTRSASSNDNSWAVCGTVWRLTLIHPPSIFPHSNRPSASSLFSVFEIEEEVILTADGCRKERVTMSQEQLQYRRRQLVRRARCQMNRLIKVFGEVRFAGQRREEVYAGSS